jgi:hypothetical protein
MRCTDSGGAGELLVLIHAPAFADYAGHAPVNRNSQRTTA